MASLSQKKEEDNALLRAELNRLRIENRELRANLEDITSLGSWPKRLKDGAYAPQDIVTTLKQKLGLEYDDNDAVTLLRWHGFNPLNVREEAFVKLTEEMEEANDAPIRSYGPMFFFAARGDLRMCSWLYENGAAEEIRKKYEEGDPMLVACHQGYLNICKWLLNKGVSVVRTADTNGYTHMHMACSRGHIEVCQWLRSVGAREDIHKTVNGYTPMLLACLSGHLSVCQFLFAAGAADDIRKANNSGETPMHMACQMGHLSICQWLFDVGAAEDIRTPSNSGYTPMLMACFKGHLSICQWLLDVGAGDDIYTPDKQGITPLQLACKEAASRTRREGRFLICQWLVLKGALINPKSAKNHDVDQGIIERHIRGDHRSALRTWAQDTAAENATFRDAFLMGTFVPDPSCLTDCLRCAYVSNGLTVAAADITIGTLSEEQRDMVLQQLRPRAPLSRLSGHADILELIADFHGNVLRGRELRLVRSFKDCLDKMWTEELTGTLGESGSLYPNQGKGIPQILFDS